MLQEAAYILVGEPAYYFDKGLDAFDKGLGKESNPYTPSTDANHYWNEGWEHAKNNPYD